MKRLQIIIQLNFSVHLLDTYIEFCLIGPEHIRHGVLSPRGKFDAFQHIVTNRAYISVRDCAYAPREKVLSIAVPAPPPPKKVATPSLRTRR